MTATAAYPRLPSLIGSAFTVLLILVLAPAGCCTGSEASPGGTVIYNDIGSDIGLWKDTTGRPLHAHGGGLYTEGETFFWVGDVGRMTADVPYFDSYSIAMYSSADLSNWQLLSSSILTG